MSDIKDASPIASVNVGWAEEQRKREDTELRKVAISLALNFSPVYSDEVITRARTIEQYLKEG